MSLQARALHSECKTSDVLLDRDGEPSRHAPVGPSHVCSLKRHPAHVHMSSYCPPAPARAGMTAPTGGHHSVHVNCCSCSQAKKGSGALLSFRLSLLAKSEKTCTRRPANPGNTKLQGRRRRTKDPIARKLRVHRNESRCRRMNVRSLCAFLVDTQMFSNTTSAGRRPACMLLTALFEIILFSPLGDVQQRHMRFERTTFSGSSHC